MRTKLDDKIPKCIFVGYSEEYKAYILYNPITNKYVINRDVVFKEEEAWDENIVNLIVDDTVAPHTKDEEGE